MEELDDFFESQQRVARRRLADMIDDAAAIAELEALERDLPGLLPAAEPGAWSGVGQIGSTPEFLPIVEELTRLQRLRFTQHEPT